MSLPVYTTTRGCKTASQPAPDVPFFTPAQIPPAGSAITTEYDAAAAAAEAEAVLPTLFTPLTIRGVTLANRFVVAPMCMHSADDGHLTEFHVVHIGQFALHGAALSIIEMTNVTPEGRITPECSGLWKDSQIEPLRRVVDFVHSQNQKIGVQLAHAGRKSSVRAPWLAKSAGQLLCATESEGGWPNGARAPSALPYAPGWVEPAELSLAEIGELQEAFVAAARRAVEASVDVIEIHGAHGYLMMQFLSPTSNQRTDAYGGTFENRTRMLLETVRAVRAVIPDTMPLFLRVSGTEWLENVEPKRPSWTLADTIRLADLLPAAGVDLLDVSSGGNSKDQDLGNNKRYQVDLVPEIKAALRAQGSAAADSLLLGAVGYVQTAELAAEVVQQGGNVGADVVLAARQFLREPTFVRRVAQELGVPVRWPVQYMGSRYDRFTTKSQVVYM